MARRRAVVTARGLDSLLAALTAASDADPGLDRRAQGEALDRLRRAVLALRRLSDLGNADWNARAYDSMRALDRRAKAMEARLRAPPPPAEPADRRSA
jgi:hypothetical protein